MKKSVNTPLRKRIIVLCALCVGAVHVVAQINPMMDENVDSIKVSYVPNRFADNWELSLNGGVSVLFGGMGHTQATTSATKKGGKYNFYDAVGGVADLTATKWFNPYVAGRFGWTTGYLPYQRSQSAGAKKKTPMAPWHNYAHIDMLWDWTTQFGGYNPNRIYDAVPYVHVGIVGNPLYNVMVGGGAGFLSRFHLNNSWLINLDLRATATTSRKFGYESGIAIELNAFVGVSYRFNERGWKKKMYNPYGPEVRRLQDENDDLAHQLQEARMKNSDLARQVQKAQEEKRIKEQVTKEVYRGLPDTLDMTVYYSINSSKLSKYEQAHLRTYIRMVELGDPTHEHRYLVIGTADKGTGSLATNERLSMARAEAIKQALVENGVDEERIEVKTELLSDGDARMARSSHVVMYPLPKEE